MIGFGDIVLAVVLIGVVIAWVAMDLRGQLSVNLYWLNRVFLIGTESVGFRLGGFLFSSRFLSVV